MKFGLTLPQIEQMDLRRDIPLVAREAEAAGYASLWAYERVLFPLTPSEGLYGVPGRPWTDAYRSTAEPLTVLTVAGAVTERVRLGTCLLVAGLHSAHRLARTLATLDQVTGGRVVLGMGTGWSSDEYRASGADFERRGESLDETMAAVTALWGPDPVSYQDSRMVVKNALVLPKPVSPIPVLLGGGGTRRAIERVARKADGWIPTDMPTEMMARQWQAIRDQAASFGRDPDTLSLVPLLHLALSQTPAGSDRMPFTGSVEQIVEDVAGVAEAGASEAILGLRVDRGGPEVVEHAAKLIDAFTAAGL